MNGSLIPANTKKSTLIFGIYRFMPDLLILIISIIISVIALIVLNSANTIVIIIACIPMLLGVLLTLPLPNYHNVLCGIQSILGFYNGRRNYIWRGWCLKNEFKEPNK